MTEPSCAPQAEQETHSGEANSKDTCSNDTHLSETNLSETNLSETNLSETNLSETNLSETGFSELDHQFMARAMELARIAESHNEIPVGAVIVNDGQIIGEGYNQSIMNNDPSAHAEMIAIRQAGQHLNNYRLIDCTLYVTLEPCPMCAGLLVHSRVKRVVYGTTDEKTGAGGTVFNLLQSPKLNHLVDVDSGLKQSECSDMLSSFFKRRRAEIKALKKAKKAKLEDS